MASEEDKSQDKSVKLTLRLTLADYRILEEEAEKTGDSKTQIIRGLLRNLGKRQGEGGG